MTVKVSFQPPLHIPAAKSVLLGHVLWAARLAKPRPMVAEALLLTLPDVAAADAEADELPEKPASSESAGEPAATRSWPEMIPGELDM